MDYDGIVDSVAELAGVSPDQAEILTRATLETLSELLSATQTLDLAAQLPAAMHPQLRPRSGAAGALPAEEFVGRVAARAGIDPDQAVGGARAVFATLRRAVPNEDFQELLSGLPGPYTELVPPAAHDIV